MGVKDVLSKAPIWGGLFDDSGDKADAALQENKDLWNNLQTPEINWENFNPDSYSAAGKLSPEMAQATTVSEDPLTRSAQMSALAKMAGLAESGITSQDDLALNNAARTAARTSQNAKDSAINDARSRGVAGSGLEFALREMGAQSAAERAQQEGLARAAQAAQQRAMYNTAYLTGESNLRDQDYKAGANNASILNDFNKVNTQAKNTAQATNLTNAQNISNKNVDTRNEAQKYNMEGSRGVLQQNYNNQLSKIHGQTGVIDQERQDALAEQAANAAKRKALGSAAGGIAGAAMGGPMGAQIGAGIGGGLG